MKRSLRLVLAAAVATVLIVPVAAVGSHDFIDVPDGHTFHSHISWLADNGITKGCNPPANDQYCPDDNVTRGQMAAFMKRLSEAKVVDAATAVAADTAAMADDSALLDGMSVDDLKVLTFADMAVDLGPTDVTMMNMPMLTLDFEVPVDGSIVVTHSTSLAFGVDPTAIAVGPSLGDCTDIAFPTFAFAEVSVDDEYDSAAGVVAFNVEAGAHTVSYCFSLESADVELINAQLGVVFQPGGVVPEVLPPVMISDIELWEN